VPQWPSPLDVLHQLGLQAQSATFRTALYGSIRRMAIGYVLVTVLGVTVGLLLGCVRFMDDMVGSMAVALHAIPGAAWVPLAMLWFGASEHAVITTILLGATGIVAVETSAGVRHVPPLLVRAARTMGAQGLGFFWYVVMPAAIPHMINGLRLAWAFGWRALMAGELIIAIPGLGQLLSDVAKAGQVDTLLALMVIMAVIGMIVDELIFKRIEETVRVRYGLVN
jgi:NitT/TauT family transport system permease protein